MVSCIFLLISSYFANVSIFSPLTAPILIVQHLSSHFMDTFADNLDMECGLKIRVAKNGEYDQSGHVYTAPRDIHMEISIENKNPVIKIYKGTPVKFCMPSIDVLFFSVAKLYRNRAMGIILTGMGSDGVEGLVAIKIGEWKNNCSS